jgi:hypothetical protein
MKKMLIALTMLAIIALVTTIVHAESDNANARDSDNRVGVNETRDLDDDDDENESYHEERQREFSRGIERALERVNNTNAREHLMENLRRHIDNDTEYDECLNSTGCRVDTEFDDKNETVVRRVKKAHFLGIFPVEKVHEVTIDANGLARDKRKNFWENMGFLAKDD